MEALKESLINWNGKEITSVQTVYNQHISDPDFISNLTKWSIQNDELQDASTWLLKH